jgi:16S rRNA (cytosine1402-N4)-methyltransferase
MDRSTGVPAAEMIADVSEADLAGIIKKYGEERGARRIARSICRQRDRKSLRTTGDLRQAIAATGPSHPNKTLARVFQAVRIQVNDEMTQLDDGLNSAIESLPIGGRLAVISYHSLEDRLVKVKMADLMRGCICPPRMPVCACGRKPQFKGLYRKPLKAGAQEVADNPRARSALLRISERIRGDESA